MSDIRFVRFGLVGLALAFFVRAQNERRFLAQVLDQWVGTQQLDTDDQLRALHHILHDRIDPMVVDRRARRPLLRARAADTWRSGSGLCGENARLAIALLSLGGVRANRLYLRGARWDHCMVEAHWRDAWVAFDGHEDPKLQMSDAQIGQIPSNRVDRFPNRARQNPWLRAVRFKPLLRVSPSALDRLRPHRSVVRVAESPDLLRALACGVVALCTAAIGRRPYR